jgi:hypothetical protein
MGGESFEKETQSLVLSALRQLGERLHREPEPGAAPVFSVREKPAMECEKQGGGPTDRRHKDPQAEDIRLPHAGESRKRLKSNKAQKRLQENHGKDSSQSRLN